MHAKYTDYDYAENGDVGDVCSQPLSLTSEVLLQLTRLYLLPDNRRVKRLLGSSVRI